MRSSSLLLILFVLAAGVGGYFFLKGGTSTTGLEGPQGTQEDQGLNPGDLGPGATTSETPGGGREEVNGVSTEEGAGSETAFSTPDPSESNSLVGIVIDAAGIGLSNCEVRFLEGGPRAIQWNSSGHLDMGDVPAVVTGPDGRFRFESLTPGDTHALLVHHKEIALRIVEGVIIGDYGEFEEPPILLTHGKRLKGRVTNEFGLPVGGAELFLDGKWMPANPQPSSDRQTAVTDVDGNYEILGIPDGIRCLSVQAPGLGRLTRIQSLIFMDKTGPSHTVNFELKSETILSGRVTDLDGTGIPGIEVLAVDRVAYRDVGNSRTVSEADGSFSIRNLPPGKYQVTARAPGYQVAIKDNVETPIDNLNMILDARPMIRGVVVAAEDGAAISKFTLRLLHNFRGPEGPGTPRGETTTFNSSASGEFSLPMQYVGGSWRVLAEAQGFAPTASDSFAFDGTIGVEGVVVAMARGGSIRGRLIDASGEPVQGGRIGSQDNAWTDDAMSQALGGDEGLIGTVRSVRAGEDGRFVVPNLRPATYQVFVRAIGLHQQVVRGLEVTEGGDLDLGDIVLQAGGDAHGVVFDEESTPVPGSMVFLNPVGQTAGARVRRGKAGQEGMWSIRNVVPGEYKVSAKPPGEGGGLFGMWPGAGGESIQIQGGADEQRNVHLVDYIKPKPPEPAPPTGNLNGHVLAAGAGGEEVGEVGEGQALVGIGVQLASVDDPARKPMFAKTDREGVYTIANILPGDYDVWIMEEPDSKVRVTIVAFDWTNQNLQSSQ